MKQPAPDLQARALGWLAQREQSRSELRRKLLRLARQRAVDDSERTRTAAADDRASAPVDAPVDTVDLAAQVDRLLDRLQSQGLLSEDRFVESRIRARAPAFGVRRIAGELAHHGLELPPQARRQLQDSELQRALQLWQRRFGAATLDDVRERARQMRFLAARGFSGEVIRRVLAGRALPPQDDPPQG